MKRTLTIVLAILALLSAGIMAHASTEDMQESQPAEQQVAAPATPATPAPAVTPQAEPEATPEPSVPATPIEKSTVEPEATPAAEPSSDTQGAKVELREAANDLSELSDEPISQERSKKLDRIVDRANRSLRQRHVTRRDLTKSQLTQMLKDLGYLGSGSSDWGRNEVQFCLQEGILIGRTSDSTPASAEWKSACTKEELAAGLAALDRLDINRVNKEADKRASADEANNDLIKKAGILLALGLVAIWRKFAAA